MYGAWDWRGLVAYAAGFLAEIPFMVLPPIAGFSYTGYFPRHLTNGVASERQLQAIDAGPQTAGAEG